MPISRWCYALVLAAFATAASAESLGGRSVGRALITGIERNPSILVRTDTMTAMPATADHPLFVSGFLGSDEQVVARTKYGDITALDLYLFSLVRGTGAKPYLLDAYRKAKKQGDRELLAKELRREIRDYVFINFVMPKLRPEGPLDDLDTMREYAYSLPGYQLAYIQNLIRPQMVILPADRVKYLQEHSADVAQPDRWRVRYIRISSPETDSVEKQDAVEDTLNSIKEQVERGELDFGEAAAKHSEAPSAERGGEIPPFRRGELFFNFEEAASSIQPGEVSNIFRGPDGLYLVNLLEAIPGQTPSLEDPQQAMKVDEGLTRQVLKAQYRYEMERLLIKRRPVYTMTSWDSRKEDEVVGRVGEFCVTKQQFRDLYPAIESDDLKRRDTLLQTAMRNMLERESMAQEVRACGFENDPLLVRTKQIASNLRRFDTFVECIYRQMNVNEKVVHSFWKENPRLFTPIAMKRVVKLTLSPANIAATSVDVRGELIRILATGGEPEEETGVQEVVTEETSEEESETTNATKAEKENPAGSTAVMEPAKGGAAPESAAGGNAPTKTYVPEEKANWYSATGIPRAAELHMPEVRQEQCEPDQPVRVTERVPLASSISCKIPATQIRDYVRRYTSADYQLRYDDYGFMYIADRPEIPASVEGVPVGSFSNPTMQGASAVTYFIEAARRPAKPPFEEIKSHAYATYRQVQMYKQLKRQYDSEVDKANIRFAF